MSDGLSFAEIDGQHVDLLPPRTVLSVYACGCGDGDGSDGGQGGDGGHGGDAKGGDGRDADATVAGKVNVGHVGQCNVVFGGEGGHGADSKGAGANGR